MNTSDISNIFKSCLNEETQDINRCAVGIGNQVYIVKCENDKYIFRCSMEQDAYKDTIYWLERLADLNIPVSKVLFHGKYEGYMYLILNYIEGEDIGLVYENLTVSEKRRIAKDVMEIQRKVSGLQLDENKDNWTWYDFLFYCLLFCVDFMSERGMQFGDKIVEVNANVVKSFNMLYDELYKEFTKSL